MAEREYDSIIDAMLDQREPDWKDLGMEAEKDSGEEQLDRTHQYVDKGFVDDIAESASRHTPVWGEKAGNVYERRIAEKEAAAPRIVSVTAYRRMDEYKSRVGDDEGTFADVTESVESAYRGSDLAPNSAEKKSVSDAEVQKYVRDLLNQGASPAKVAQQLQKLAEIELFNHQSAEDYLTRNAGLLGLAYLEPNTYMEKNSPTYERTASGGNACEAQKRAWDAEGIRPQAQSVKQVRACQGCAYFNKDARGKACNLYHLPLVASAEELSQIVNHLTPGVPNGRKHAALVQIANGEGRRAQAATQILSQTDWVKTADAKTRNQEKRASSGFRDDREASRRFSSEHVSKLHAKGASLERIYKWAEPRFGSVDTSFAFRGFVQSLRKNAAGRIVVESGDLGFLNGIGIRSAAFEGAAKCASCEHHKRALSPMIEYEEEAVDIRPCRNCDADQRRFTYDDNGEVFCEECGEVQPVSVEDLIAYQQSGKTGSKAGRVDQKFASSSPHVAASKQADRDAEVVVTAAKVRTLHQAGHSVEKIYGSAARKVGSVAARKAVAGFVDDLRKRPGKVAVSEPDRAFLIGKLGFRPEQVRALDPQRRPVTQVVAAVPDDQHLLSYPGMGKHAGEKRQADGNSLLAEYDLAGGQPMQDIDVSGPKREDVEMKSSFEADLE